MDTGADHLAAWRLDQYGNPVGQPRRFDYDLSGTATHRDAQLRHALTLLHWAKTTGVQAIAIEDLDFTDSKTREKHGRRKRFRKLISGIPTGKLRARLLSMCTQAGIGVIAVDPAYTSIWGTIRAAGCGTNASDQDTQNRSGSPQCTGSGPRLTPAH
ncbi:hypothetical protein GCM10022206_67220 [Streptomyces chiangmaiensis]